MVQARATLRRSDGGEELDNANIRRHAPRDGGNHAPARLRQLLREGEFQKLDRLKIAHIAAHALGGVE